MSLAKKETMDRIQEQLSTLMRDQPFTTRWALYDFRNAQFYGERFDEPQWTASTRKVSVMMCVLSEVTAGRIDLDREVEYTSGMAEGVQSGTFRYMTPGFSFPLRDALTQMNVSSDNVCTRLVFESLGADEREQLRVINDFCQNSGLHQTIHRHVFPDTSRIPWFHTDAPMTTSTPIDQIRLLKAIVAGSQSASGSDLIAVSQDLCSYALELMTLGWDSFEFARFLPDDVVVAQKGGRGVRGRSEIGVIFDSDGRAACALAVYTDWVQTRLRDGRPGNDLAIDLISAFGRSAWELVVNNTDVPASILDYGRPVMS